MISNRIKPNLHRRVFQQWHHRLLRNSRFHRHLVLNHFYFKIHFPVENVKISLHLPVVVIPVSPIVNLHHIIIIVIIIEVLIYLLNVIHVYRTFVHYVHHRIQIKKLISLCKIIREENLFQLSIKWWYLNWMVLVESNLIYPYRVIVHLHNLWKIISNKIHNKTGKWVIQSYVSVTLIRYLCLKNFKQIDHQLLTFIF